jgi:peptidoglycan/xylan/chitin deacetylase (PgdA/CDA1 family)|nr:polysaccharide deacetylase family protein [Micromonospora sp. HM5-17]
MGTMSRGRMVAVAAVVTTAILGSTYLLGRSLGMSGVGPERPAASRVEAGSAYPAGAGPEGEAGFGTGTEPEATSGDEPDDGSAGAGSRDREPTPSTTATPAPSGSGTGDHARGHEGQLPPEPSGPQGARRTTGSSDVALTFDDGPDPRFTPQVLALLRRFQVKATFCLVGENVRAYPELVRAIAADGHTLCNHSWSHDVDLGKRPYATILADLRRTSDAIRAVAPGAVVAYYRQPGGNWTASVAAAARQLGMTPLHWTVDPRDWARPGAGNIVTTVTTRTFPGAIVLLHDAGGDRRGTVSALYPILVTLGRRYALAALPTGTPTEHPVGTDADRTSAGRGVG